MKTMRAFFAILPPCSMHAQLTSIIELLKQSIPENSLNWTKIENLHITLQFLSAIQSRDLSSLNKNVAKELKNVASFELEFGDLEWFPMPGQAKILSLDVGPQTVLSELSAKIACAITPLNYPVETRPFRGHMTLGRLFKDKVQQSVPLSQITLPAIPAITIKELYLVESKLGNQGSNYQLLEQFNLGSR